ncbi:group I intron endonuclease [Aneurinibacillus soli]|uniref:GIY-YIG catalytic domain protein n=1 Tax=Aneurinibacillus soli TaxID=1500254 RepID=A0A0U5C8M8_9BACL|nr:GIY-YIG nuclease family protein [Aneurinibacillus soli]PYE62121.1 group I intron endonuclease [Aneurinibacillus soli]BAU28691.1 GIY-YIG catalytic domain protein [Aneurinibacillus soli]
MDRKKELKQQYKEIKVEAGVYQIKNMVNGKIFIGSSPNLKNLNGRRFELKMGVHKNQMLQKEWNEYGEDAFVFEIVEVLKKKENGYFDLKDALKKLEEKWLDTLQPFDERGYNKPSPACK